MISYYDGQLTDILPFNIAKDAEVQALSYALQQATRLLYRYSKRLYIYTNLDEQPEEVIDLLASELRTQYYQSDMELDIKRELVKNTLIWYMAAGTPAAVEELVTAVFGDGAVKEWFDYGGQPYCFKVSTNAILTENMAACFADMIRRVKNTRSHLDAIEIPRRLDQTIYAGAAAESTSQPTAIMGGYSINRQATRNLQAGVAVKSTSTPEPITDGYRIDRDATADLWTRAATVSIATPEPVMDGFYIKRKAQAVIWPAMALNGIYTNLAKEGDHATTF